MSAGEGGLLVLSTVCTGHQGAKHCCPAVHFAFTSAGGVYTHSATDCVPHLCVCSCVLPCRRLKAVAEEKAPLTEERQEQWDALELPQGLAALQQLVDEKVGGRMGRRVGGAY